MSDGELKRENGGQIPGFVFISVFEMGPKYFIFFCYNKQQ